MHGRRLRRSLLTGLHSFNLYTVKSLIAVHEKRISDGVQAALSPYRNGVADYLLDRGGDEVFLPGWIPDRSKYQSWQEMFHR